MAKNKRLIKKKETKYERRIAFDKRSKGLLRKAFELSVLCDVDVALIMYSPSGTLRHFSGKKKLERILQDYIKDQATIAEKNPGEDSRSDKPAISQDIIDKINLFAGQANATEQQGKSIHVFEERKRCLQEALHKIQERKKTILSRFNIGTSTHSSQPNLQSGNQLQQIEIDIEAPSTTQPQEICGIDHEFAVPPHLPEAYEGICNGTWSVEHISNYLLDGAVPVQPKEIEVEAPSATQDPVPVQPKEIEVEAPSATQPQETCSIDHEFVVPPLPESFEEISNDIWSVEYIINHDFLLEDPVPVQPQENYFWSPDDWDKCLWSD